jgi:hypothetical protein
VISFLFDAVRCAYERGRAEQAASLRAQIEQLPRSDMVTNYRCGESIDELEPASDGEWVRVETVLALLAKDDENTSQDVVK